MEVSIFLAKVMGLYMVVMMLVILMSGKSFLKGMKKFVKDRTITLFAGVFTLILGILVVVSHNTWKSDWTTLITVLGWLTLIKGIMYLVFPVTMEKLTKRFSTKIIYAIFMPIALLVGGFLIYMGFFA